MTQGHEANVLFDKVVETVEKLLAPQGASSAADFARAWLGSVDAQEFTGIDTAELAAAVAGHWALLQDFRPGQTALRVFDPQTEENGWTSPHTVVAVVTDSMPFLADSLTMEVGRRGLTLHRMVHATLQVRRDEDGSLRGVVAAEGTGVRQESVLYLEVDRLPDAAAREALAAALEQVLGEVRAAVEDWPAMRKRVEEIAAEIGRNAPSGMSGEVDEARALLEWLLDGNFVMLGCRDQVLSGEGEAAQLDIVPGSGLGVLRDSGKEAVSRAFAALPAEVRAHAHDPVVMTVAQSTSRSTGPRSGYLDYISVRLFDDQGKVCGERRLMGLFAATAYSANPWNIPVLRNKVAEVTARAELAPTSPAAKALRVVL